MAELGLKKKEIEAIDFAFDVYDLKGDGRVDAFYAGDLFCACNLNSTLKTIKEIGGVTEKGQKYLKKEEIYPIYKTYKDSKDQGSFHDFVENLKLYDTNANNQPSPDDSSDSEGGHPSKKKGKKNEVLEAIRILNGERKTNPVDTTQNIKTQFLQCQVCPTLLSTLQ